MKGQRKKKFLLVRNQIFIPQFRTQSPVVDIHVPVGWGLEVFLFHFNLL